MFGKCCSDSDQGLSRATEKCLMLCVFAILIWRRKSPAAAGGEDHIAYFEQHLRWMIALLEN